MTVSPERRAIFGGGPNSCAPLFRLSVLPEIGVPAVLKSFRRKQSSLSSIPGCRRCKCSRFDLKRSKPDAVCPSQSLPVERSLLPSWAAILTRYAEHPSIFRLLHKNNQPQISRVRAGPESDLNIFAKHFSLFEFPDFDEFMNNGNVCEASSCIFAPRNLRLCVIKSDSREDIGAPPSASMLGFSTRMGSTAVQFGGAPF